uniref:Uncharacterized protein n=1 Tax=Mycena chlorophos TaxID=658473 RepID=A0ABQ0LNY6_MYCCL|nr:predicted protein [Mycena chlorophos]
MKSSTSTTPQKCNIKDDPARPPHLGQRTEPLNQTHPAPWPSASVVSPTTSAIAIAIVEHPWPVPGFSFPRRLSSSTSSESLAPSHTRISAIAIPYHIIEAAPARKRDTNTDNKPPHPRLRVRGTKKPRPPNTRKQYRQTHTNVEAASASRSCRLTTYPRKEGSKPSRRFSSLLSPTLTLSAQRIPSNPSIL